MKYRELMFEEVRQFARFKKGALAYNDTVDVYHMMRCVQLFQQAFDSLTRFEKVDRDEYNHMLNLIDKMNDHAFNVAIKIRSDTWGLLNDIFLKEGV